MKGDTVWLTNPSQLVHDNIYRWRLGLMVINSESAFNGGYFKVSEARTRLYETSTLLTDE